MAEAGHAGGFDAGLYYVDGSYANVAEIAITNLAAVGIRLRLQPVERAAFFAGYSAKKYCDGVIQSHSGALGNAATRLVSFIVKGGAFAYGSYPDIDALLPQQTVELNPKKRAAILVKIQHL